MCSSSSSDIWSAVVGSLEDGRWTGTLLLVAAALGLLSWLLLQFIGVESRRRRVLPPGPWGLPIVGYLPFLSREAPYVSLVNLAHRYGAIFRLRLGAIPTVVLADPTLVRAAFKKDVFCGRPPLFVTNGILEGYGLISAEGERWKEQRRFVSKRLREFGATKSTTMSSTAAQLEKRIVGEISAFHQKLRQYEGRPFDVHSMVRTTVANLTTAMVFGKTFEDGDPVFQKQLDVADSGSEMVDVAGTLNFLPFLRFLPKFRRFLRHIWNCKAEHQAFLTAIVEEHRRRVHDDDDVHDFIDAYLAEMDRRKNDVKGPSHFTVKQLLHVLSDLFGASLDTLNATIKWTFLHLALNPDVQRKCQEEMDSIIGRHRDPTLEDRVFCTYTMATVFEAQRLANVVPLGAPHGSTEDAFLADYFIPKGTMIISLLWAINTDPHLWPEPTAFRPERFLDEYGALHVPEHFFPFSTGKRLCVGEELAKMTLFLLVAITLHRFTVSFPTDERPPDLTPVAGFIISPHPYRMCAAVRFDL